MSEPQWLNPNSFSLCFRISEEKYAEAFLERGSIKFGTPQKWVDYARTKGTGRGDLFEGATAGFHCLDIEHYSDLQNKYPADQISCLEFDGTIYVKRTLAMNIPCFCVYVLKNSMFPCPSQDGQNVLCTQIGSKLFTDFAGDITEEKFQSAPKGDRPSIIVIENFAELQNRLESHLLGMGIKKEEIIVNLVHYHDFHMHGKQSWFDLMKPFPHELFLKDAKFAYQSECRFVINSKNDNAMDILRNSVIEIGSLIDIGKIIYDYPYKGMTIDLHTNVKSIQ